MFFREPKVIKKEIAALIENESKENNFFLYFLKSWSNFGKSINHLNNDEFQSAAASLVDSLTYQASATKELFLNIETLAPSLFRLCLTMIQLSLAEMETNLVTFVNDMTKDFTSLFSFLKSEPEVNDDVEMGIVSPAKS